MKNIYVCLITDNPTTPPDKPGFFPVKDASGRTWICFEGIVTLLDQNPTDNINLTLYISVKVKELGLSASATKCCVFHPVEKDDLAGLLSKGIPKPLPSF
jgi:hypothetical protein